MNICIVGGGIVGLATALQLRRQAPAWSITLLEKEPDFGLHQSTHNSGVLHAGLHYRPGSFKARLAVSGIRMMTEFCREHGVAHEICGKLVVATDEAAAGRLRVLLNRGTENGLTGLRWLNAAELREVEPHAGGIAAVHVPEEGIVDYAGVIRALVAENRRLGVELHASTKVEDIRRESGGWRVISTRAEHRCDFLVNCAGLYCDRVAALAGERRETRIVPFRGEFYRLKADRTGLVRGLIYPVPEPGYPFLGVHFTRLVRGGVEAGPNAILATAREGYRKTNLNLADLWDAVTFPGLWRFIVRHRAMCLDELGLSFSKRRFCAALQKLVPEITEADLEPGGTGVRAQAMTPAGELVKDFALIERPNALHVLNAPSPAATASLAIGAEIAGRVRQLAAGEGNTGVAQKIFESTDRP